MELHQALIKNFAEYLNGQEVEARVHLEQNETISEGEAVLVVKDTIANATPLVPPVARFDQVIGVEGIVTSETPRGPIAGPQDVIVRVKKA